VSGDGPPTHQHLQMGAHQLANGADPYFQFTRLPDEPASGSQSSVCEGLAACALEGTDSLRPVHGLTRCKGGAFVGKCGHHTAPHLDIAPCWPPRIPWGCCADGKPQVHTRVDERAEDAHHALLFVV